MAGSGALQDAGASASISHKPSGRNRELHEIREMCWTTEEHGELRSSLGDGVCEDLCSDVFEAIGAARSHVVVGVSEGGEQQRMRQRAVCFEFAAPCSDRNPGVRIQGIELFGQDGKNDVGSEGSFISRVRAGMA